MRWSGHLGRQDRAPHNPHITVQNKVSPEQARALFEELTRTFRRAVATACGLSDCAATSAAPGKRCSAFPSPGHRIRQRHRGRDRPHRRRRRRDGTAAGTVADVPAIPDTRALLILGLRTASVVAAAPAVARKSVHEAVQLGRAASAAAHLVDDVAELVQRADRILDAVEPTLLRAGTQLDPALVDELVRALRSAPALVDAAAETLQRLQAVADAAGDAANVASGLSDTAAGLLRRVQPAVELGAEVAEHVRGPVRQVLPMVENEVPKLADSAPGLLESLGDVLSQLPSLLRRVDEEALPAIVKLQTAPDDVRAVKESVEEMQPLVENVEEQLGGFPGAAQLRRRGRRE